MTTSIYVCQRAEDLPVSRPESVKGRCRDCGTAVWMMPHAPIASTDVPIVCLTCAAKRIAASIEAGGSEFTVAPGRMILP